MLPGAFGTGLLGGKPFIPPSATNPITASMVASRTTGVGPLLVHFDATATTSTETSNPFRDLAYEWDFGPDVTGNWSVTGFAKRHAQGPVAGIVFETPGDHIVTLTIRDAAGNSRSLQETIVVDDPDVVFASTATVCISQAGDFTGAPSGAQQITTSTMADIQTHLVAGNRVLLRRGETWGENDRLDLDAAGPGILGAFGSGANPLFNGSTDSPWMYLSSTGTTPQLDDWRIMDIDVAGSNTTDRCIEVRGNATRVLMLRLDLSGFKGMLWSSESGFNFWNNQHGSEVHDYPDACGVVECEIHEAVGGGGGNNVFFAAQRLCVLGSDDYDATSSEHVWRTQFSYKGVFSNSRFSDAAATKHCMALRAPGWSDSGLGFERHTELNVFDRCLFEGTSPTNSWVVQAGPKNTTADERLRDNLFSRCTFTHGADSVIGMFGAGSTFTVRNCIADLTAVPSGTSAKAFEVAQRGIEPIPNDGAFLNNTVWSNGGGDYSIGRFASGGSGHVGHNNLIVAPSAASVGLVAAESGTSATLSNNLQGPQSDLVDPVNGDYHLAAGATAIDAGTPVEVVDDYDGNDRPQGAAYDVGAFERAA